ncbi:unnamed protein product [Rotaria socialis]|uniref:Uncharacterized protein n=1 Tax=Rotaria socialis TaxID=392032 RepID=A0A817W2C7_9BILA|nr:unnamed protein product [Rotaria socialis]CAF3350492.1 unnamed protein product [Rotaria socialis]CAF3391488.1 unnamed protein product [Rotaria socialis]CAF3441969.1 unnamed protein product [Rotaria socialis]CAF3697445.1 unnamed protein product [Rotaria socialis]
MIKNLFCLTIFHLLSFQLTIITCENNEVVPEVIRGFLNKNGNQRSQSAPKKIEDRCGFNGKNFDRICGSFEQELFILSSHPQNKKYSLREVLERKESATQFLHTIYRRKRLIYPLV